MQENHGKLSTWVYPVQPECMQAAVKVEKVEESGSLAEFLSDGGSSRAHKVCVWKLCGKKTWKCVKFSSLENAHAPINLHSLKKAKHILKKKTCKELYSLNVWNNKIHLPVSSCSGCSKDPTRRCRQNYLVADHIDETCLSGRVT